jgi:hypothetical protein
VVKWSPAFAIFHVCVCTKGVEENIHGLYMTEKCCRRKSRRTCVCVCVCVCVLLLCVCVCVCVCRYVCATFIYSIDASSRVHGICDVGNVATACSGHQINPGIHSLQWKMRVEDVQTNR